MLEFEKKVMLTEEEYNCLMKLKDIFVDSFVQANYYYDSDDYEMNAMGITCRIREKDGVYQATIKAHQSKESECSRENSQTVLSEYDDSLFRNMDLKMQGFLITYRCIMFSHAGVEIVIDKNSYLGITDYELEIEYAVEKKQQAESLLGGIAQTLSARLCGINVDKFYESSENTKSKSERFFELKQKMQKEHSKSKRRKIDVFNLGRD